MATPEKADGLSPDISRIPEPQPTDSLNHKHHAPEPPTSPTLPSSDPPTDSSADDKHVGPQPLPKLRLVAITVGVALGLFLSMLDSSIVATSLFTIAIEFGDVDRINWVALAYSLTFLSCAVLFARISDVVGRRVAFVAAYVVFIVFSLACGFARNMGQLIAFRAVQGLGGSGLYSLSMIILPEVTPDRAKKHIAAVVASVLTVAGVGGPVLGGVLTEYTSWRWVFWINGPIGGVSLVGFLLAWPDKKYLPSLERRAWKDVDFVGAFLLIASAVLIVFPFQNASQNPQWTSAIFLAPLLTGILSLALLFLWQSFLTSRTKNTPRERKIGFALPPVLLRNRVYAATALQTTLTGFPYMLCVYAFPVRFQVVYGKSALEAGLMLLPMLAASAMGTVVAGAVNAGKPGQKQRFFETLMVAGALMLLGCGLETTAGSEGVVEAKVLGFLVFIGLGFGLAASGGTMCAGAEAPVWEHASAQGIVAQVRVLGGSIGIAASSAILGTKTQSGTPPEALAHMTSTLSPEQWASIRKTYTDALREDMIVCCGVLALAMVCTLGVYRRNRVSMEEMLQQRYREEAERRRAAGEAEAPGKGALKVPVESV